MGAHQRDLKTQFMEREDPDTGEIYFGFVVYSNPPISMFFTKEHAEQFLYEFRKMLRNPKIEHDFSPRRDGQA